MKKKLLLVLLCIGIKTFSQDLTQIGKAKLLTVTGGLTANSVFYEGTALRDPFTYVLNGNINFNISGLYNVPLSFAYSNQEFSYSQPFRFNRLSIHPSYKWIAAHIGDVTMTFSPYTLNGHQFTGLGVDLTPSGPFKISAMYGRLIRPVEFNLAVPETEPAYRRIGYGLKTSYEFEKARVGLIFFRAKDDINSLNQPIPVDIGVNPKENLVVSLEGSLKLFDRGTLNVEYATSAVTEDQNVQSADGSVGILSFIFNERLSTSYYNAFNADISYALGNGTVGAGYERIDPDYNTFGAYFFNNDLENITINAAQTIFNDKLNVSVNAGLQRDNLDNTKKNELKRIVTAVNLNLNASERLNITGSYSNFQSFTNIRSQFDYINQISEFDTLDTLNFKQLSQNANLSIGYILSKKKEKQQNLNFNLSFQDTKDLQEQAFTGVENTVNTSQFYNGAASYTISFPENTLSVSAAFNTTLNRVMEANSVILGPTLSINKQFFDKKVRSSFSGSYNTSSNDGNDQSTVLNFRFSAGYQLLEKHQFNLNLLSLFRNTPNSKSNDFTATLGYSYSFTIASKKKHKKNRKQVPEQRNNKDISKMKFRYRKQIFNGNAEAVVSQIQSIRNRHDYIIDAKKAELDVLKNDLLLLKSEDIKTVQSKAIDYLESLYDFIDFNEKYNTKLSEAAIALNEEAKRLNPEIESRYSSHRNKLENHKFKGIAPEKVDNNDPEFTAYKELYVSFIAIKRKFAGHQLMQEELKKVNDPKQFDKKDTLKKIKIAHIDDAYQLYKNDKELSSLPEYLTKEMIRYYEERVKDTLD